MNSPTGPSTAKPALTPVLLAVLASLSAFSPLSIDMYLPALPTIATDLGASAGDIQLTLSVFMVAFGVGQIFYGPAGDRFGRRPIILGGLSLYILASVGCAFVADGSHLIGLRFLQGLSACAGVVMARTMVRDLAEKDQAARAMSLMMACTSLAPMLAPLIGGEILVLAGWRAIFWGLGAIGVVALIGAGLRLPETLRPEYRQPFRPGAVLARFRELLVTRPFMGFALAGGFQFAALFSFLSGSPFVFIEHYGLSPRNYGLVFGSMVAFMTVGSLLNARFAPRFGASRILRSAAFIPAIAGVASAILGCIEARTGAIGMWPFFFVITPQIASISLIGPNSAVMALHRYPHMAGTASSLMGILQFGLGAAFGAVVGQSFDGTIAPMTYAMGVAGVMCLVSARVIVPRRELSGGG
jgi:DHA1 family bicyclomycin/chloramphenicol resistance-like MFS transporter